MNALNASTHATNSAPVNRRSLLVRGLRVGVSIGASATISAALTGCGFKLRGPQAYAFSSIFINAPTSALVAELSRAIQSNGDVRVLTDAKERANAQVVMDVQSDQREKTVVGVTSSGQVREFQLRIRFKFTLRGQSGKDLLPDTEILQQRDISFNETAVLSKEAEEDTLYRNMQSDIVQQITRRLAAVKQL
jgi:LPS-assembly lipoprotein